MHNETCYFMPDVFPMFPESQCDHNDIRSADGKPKLRLCTVGASKKHSMLAEALATNKTFYKDVVEVYAHARGQTVDPYTNHQLEDFVTAISTKNFVLFEQYISRCHALLPLMEPDGFEGPRSNGYFPFDKKIRKLSGSLAQIAGFSLATIIHEDLYGAYKEVIRGHVTTYNSQDGLVQALNSMIATLRESYPMVIKQACANPTIARGKKCLDSSVIPHWNNTF